ncbi:MAG: pantoate--beta-alanine ligase [Bacteroidetes bacterium]|nr:pantoate--beta-alanine ligase [Bacteroidota bacterium]
MKQFTHIAETADYLEIQREKDLMIGFVPTMGALHEGHLALIKRSLQENDITVCSIFVNPIQFNNNNDLANYPRTLSQDLKMLESCGCDVVFFPDTAEMYPDGETISFGLNFGTLDKVLEGQFRPGHFNGVAIVVKKLFDIVQPTHAYFGKKDFQQLAIIKHMVYAMGIPVEIIPCETIREVDGLAMSSRNTRLSPAERKLASGIYQTLLNVREKIGKTPVPELKEWAVKKIEENDGFRVEYFEIVDQESLMPMEDWTSRDRAVALVAVFVGDVRLIDNIELFS